MSYVFDYSKQWDIYLITQRKVCKQKTGRI